MKYVVNLDEVTLSDIKLVGGKNASTGEMIKNLTNKGINIPGGFATTVLAFQHFIEQNQLDKKIEKILASIDVEHIHSLNKGSAQIRRLVMGTKFSAEFEKAIASAYAKINSPTVAVRSSATTEDLVEASFAGQQDTFLNIKGSKNLLQAIKMVFASLFTSRAIAYRTHHGFLHHEAALSVGVQPMIRSDKAASGVMFTLDTESGFDQVILINASYGLGETIVQGCINPDEFYVFKPTLEAGTPSILERKLGSKLGKMVYTNSSLPKKSTKMVAVNKADQKRYCITDAEIETLAKQALVIEKHYGKPMDIEWAKDGLTGQLYILQARPETVKSRAQSQSIKQYLLSKKGKLLTQGQSVGQLIGHGVARIATDPKKLSALKPNEILVTDMTDPDWEPIMKNAAGIITNRGGRTCHAAIIARELGIPAIVGCGDATKKIKQKQALTISCAEGQTGYVYEGNIPFEVKEIAIKTMPDLPIKLSINMGSPEKAFETRNLPNEGVGLARLEFIISNMIGIHPNACLDYQKLDKKLKKEILEKTAAYKNPTEYYIEKLREGIATIAAAFYPKQVIFRFSDFKSNEYANLLGGHLYEPEEENPMLGFRGASRYKDPSFKEAFYLECQAFIRVREMGLTNAQLMVPFVRTVNELKEVINVIENNGLSRSQNDLKIYMMCEIPANALLAAEFLEYVDGFSIGSNDLTQLTLGLDRDSNLVASLFDERNAAIKMLLHLAIDECKKKGKYIGICGQGPSDHPDFAEWLMREGIQNISLNPDSIVSTWLMLAEKLAPKEKEALDLVTILQEEPT